MQLAIILGYEKIYLLGIDLTKDAVTHYHGGYGERADKFNAKLPNYLSCFKRGLEQMKQDNTGMEVISCSSTSQLNGIIPYQPIEEVL